MLCNKNKKIYKKHFRFSPLTFIIVVHTIDIVVTSFMRYSPKMLFNLSAVFCQKVISGMSCLVSCIVGIQ